MADAQSGSSTSLSLQASSSGSGPYIRAKFVDKYVQKPSLTAETPGKLTVSLFQLYPLLIIADCALSYVMWIHEDLCLPFIHMILICLCVNLLGPISESQPSGSFSVFNLWLGILSIVFLACSLCYYIITTYKDMETSESPTLDDIVVLVESVLDKLETMRKEMITHRIPVKDWKSILKVVIFLTPFHFVLMETISLKAYCVFFVIISLVYHSNWFQATMKLLWRILLIRQLYYIVYNIFHGTTERKSFHRSPLLNSNTLCTVKSFLSNSSMEILLPIPESIHGIEENMLRSCLRKLYPCSMSFAHFAKSLTSKFNFRMLELEISENQRKWPITGWSSKLLSYEKSHFTLQTPNASIPCEEPSIFQLNLGKGWSWLDDQWETTKWQYSDTNWKKVGCLDSLQAYTRSRTWKRRAFNLQ